MTDLRIKGYLFYLALAIIVLISSCKTIHSDSDHTPLFSLLDKKQTHIGFLNQVDYTEEYNTYTYRNFYNGAGVGLGDFNNDGLIDIYFCGNQAGNKLYINKGNFVFEDVTEQAGVAVRVMVNRCKYCRCQWRRMARYLCMQIGQSEQPEPSQ